MNLLTETPPNAVEIDGREVEVNTDFRACLRTIMAFEDPELTSQEKYGILLANLYPEPQINVQAAIDIGLRFLNGDSSKGEDGGQPHPRLYSFEHDGNLIFAAFQQTHGIDLEIVEMHWWKFLALFMDLGGDTAFCNLVALRKRIKAGTATKEEVREFNRNRESLEIPEYDSRTLEEKEKEREFFRLVEEGKRKREAELRPKNNAGTA